ncbi:hypothetical protein HAZT_HAZT010405 [Hyalella azteca]|uniref:C2H2-type domain-containing protein n=1 Tax=Hyalella azteca TaxID=294128 RepID=A0A6A0GRV0_HYAAZ|nr:hypothetical protein HAZT_HAZT010405 [Hyalella azteca]
MAVTTVSDLSDVDDSSSSAKHSSPTETAPITISADTISSELTVCQYVLPADIMVGGFEEVVEEVELGSQWCISGSTMSSPSTSNELHFINPSSTDVLFTVIEDSFTMSHFDSPKVGLDTTSFISHDIMLQKHEECVDVKPFMDEGSLEGLQKPFKCEECGATFTQNGSLQVHIRRHRGDKPFTCKLCGNSYTRAFSLKVHMKTHTGEKPHNCEY